MNVYEMMIAKKDDLLPQTAITQGVLNFLLAGYVLSKEFKVQSLSPDAMSIVFETDYVLEIPDVTGLVNFTGINQLVNDKASDKIATGIEAGYPVKGDLVAVSKGAELFASDIEDQLIIDIGATANKNRILIGTSTNSSTDFYKPFDYDTNSVAIIPVDQFVNLRVDVMSAAAEMAPERVLRTLDASQAIQRANMPRPILQTQSR